MVVIKNARLGSLIMTSRVSWTMKRAMYLMKSGSLRAAKSKLPREKFKLVLIFTEG